MDTDVIFGAWVPTGGLFCPSGYCCSKAPKWDPQWLKLFHIDNNQIFVVKMIILYQNDSIFEKENIFKVLRAGSIDTESANCSTLTVITVVCISESVWPNLCSNCPIFDLVFNDINKPPCSSPCGSNSTLTGALKWDTVWSSSSTGTGIMKGQSWTSVFY